VRRWQRDLAAKVGPATLGQRRSLALLGTGLRLGELAGLHRRRVHLTQPIPTLQVVDVRHQAGSQFGSGFRPRPSATPASARSPWSPRWWRRSAAGSHPAAIPRPCCSPAPAAAPAGAVAPGVRKGTRTMLSRHNFRHTFFSTWLEDAGIPARVIDEVMGHQASGRAGRHLGSAIGPTTATPPPEMAARVVTAVEERLLIVLSTADRS
jgi:integrase